MIEISLKTHCMNKIFFSIVALFVITFSANAQAFRAGIKLGANGTKIEGQSFEDGYQLSYQAGIFTELDFNKKWGIQPELLFGQTSSKTVSGLNAVTSNLLASRNVKLNYLSIPILLRYNVGNLITLNLGPQFGILLNQDKSLVRNGEEAFKSGDFSMVGGVQLNFKVLRVYGRYNVWLTNLNDVSSQEKWKSQQLQLGLGLKF